MFPEYSRNIPRISVSKIFQEYHGNMLSYEDILEAKKFKKDFCGLSCENLNIGSLLSGNVSLNFIETALHLE